MRPVATCRPEKKEKYELALREKGIPVQFEENEDGSVSVCVPEDSTADAYTTIVYNCATKWYEEDRKE